MFLLYFLLWVILNGKINPEIIIFGICIAAALCLFTKKAIGYDFGNDRLFFRHPLLFIWYVLNLVLEIVKAAVAVGRVALNHRKEPEPVIVEFDSGMKTDFQNVLLANSITLTPGTYTLFQENGHFVVHCLLPEYAEGMQDSSFVRILKKLS